MGEDEELGYKQYNGLWGEQLSKMKDRLVFRRRGKSICVYCGGVADTREHCPPKFLLVAPYPPNLSELPACYDCNNGFSASEEKVKVLFKKIVEIEHGEKKSFDDVCDDRLTIIYKEGKVPDYLYEVLTKIARGHAVYQLGEAFGDGPYNPTSVKMIIKSFVSEEDWQKLCSVVEIETLPELGSRNLENVLIVECINDKNKVKQNKIWVDWTISQPDVYQYLVFFLNDKIFVRMIIRECIWVQVSFENNDIM